MLDRLVRRAVFAEADGVVREHMDHALLHQRRHADGVAAVVAEGEEGAAVGNEAAVQGNAVHDGGHAEFAHAVVDVAADPAGAVGDALSCSASLTSPARSKRSGGGALGVGEVGAGQVGRAPQHFGQGGSEGLQRELRGFARGDGLRLRMGRHRRIDGDLREVARQLALHAAAELGRQSGWAARYAAKRLSHCACIASPLARASQSRYTSAGTVKGSCGHEKLKKLKLLQSL